LHAHAEQDLNRAAFSATTHCLTGCAIGEILGMVIATAAGWGNAASIAISIVLAFFFGYLLTLWPVLRAGLSLRQATGVALAADLCRSRSWRRSTTASSSSSLVL